MSAIRYVSFAVVVLVLLIGPLPAMGDEYAREIEAGANAEIQHLNQDDAAYVGVQESAINEYAPDQGLNEAKEVDRAGEVRGW